MLLSKKRMVKLKDDFKEQVNLAPVIQECH